MAKIWDLFLADFDGRAADLAADRYVDDKKCGRYILSRHEGDQHQKSRLSRLAMSKIGGEHLPYNPLILLLGFVRELRITPKTTTGAEKYYRDWLVRWKIRLFHPRRHLSLGVFAHHTQNADKVLHRSLTRESIDSRLRHAPDLSTSYSRTSRIITKK